MAHILPYPLKIKITRKINATEHITGRSKLKTFPVEPPNQEMSGSLFSTANLHDIGIVMLISWQAPIQEQRFTSSQ